MRAGLYKVEFATPLGSGAGVVVIQEGKMHGGDARIYYAGTYLIEGDQVTAKVTTDAHTLVPGMESVFGRDRVSITLTGTATGDTASLTGQAAEVPGVTFRALLTRLPPDF